MGRRDRLPGHTVDGPSKSGRIEPGRVDEVTTANGSRLVSANGQIETVIANPTRQNRSAQYNHRPGRLGLALKSEHQRVAVNNSGRGREQSGYAMHLPFEAFRLRRGEPLQVVDAIRSGRFGNALETR